MPRLPKPLTREDIERAMRATLSNRAAARYLNVSYPHYKKYAELYKTEDGKTLYESHFNRAGKGIPKFALTRVPGKHYREPALADIVEGRVPVEHYNPQKLKYRLIEAGMLEPKCACGFNEKRLVDGKSPLILIHKDGDKRNWRLENLEFVCYNCAFLRGEKSLPVTEDFVEKQEDFVDRNSMNETEVWELDDYQKEYLKSLGLLQEKEKPYQKYISRL